MALTSQQLKGQKKLHFSVYKTALVLFFLASFEVQGMYYQAPKESEEAPKSSFLRSQVNNVKMLNQLKALQNKFDVLAPSDVLADKKQQSDEVKAKKQQSDEVKAEVLAEDALVKLRDYAEEAQALHRDAYKLNEEAAEIIKNIIARDDDNVNVRAALHDEKYRKKYKDNLDELLEHLKLDEEEAQKQKLLLNDVVNKLDDVRNALITVKIKSLQVRDNLLDLDKDDLLDEDQKHRLTTATIIIDTQDI